MEEDDFSNEDEGLDRPLAEPMRPVLVGICHMCVHRTSIRNCTAFPQGIPNEILKGDFNHTESFPGDHGITFKKSDVIITD